ncbi:NAD(P)/FAD-dependent oxidoreductase [Cohnella luojiensis]|uniref:NAD(P)/FAD-dependent oxidoreductase n=1 Tax=Cohnella luojiensis TaxID=652876 RepID=A0A4Y8LVZ4_9BACL|nr:NAD(P)/FAD-dependent oxidoreductase [Cohnella luojiensis]TFE23399.1 NAD(P)/FAD-dependent oxidoreductase [Cohnella luojiensis]
MSKTYDVIVVGARVAGSSLAYWLAREGYEVLLVDRGTFPSDTLSTNNLYSNSLGLLRGMGVLDALLNTNTPIYRRAHINFDGAVIDGLFPESDGITGCLCVRRKYLDQILFENAKAQPGVTAIEGFRVTALIQEDGIITCIEGKRKDGGDDIETYSARLVVGADGRLSKVREWAGSERKIAVPTDFASYAAYVTDFVQEGEMHVEFYKNQDKLAIVFPTSDDQFVVGVMYPLDDSAWMERFKSDPEEGIRRLIDEGFGHTSLADRFRKANFAETVKGMHGYDNDWFVGMGQGWALLGDALSFKDPAVGQGLHDALYGAHMLSEILSQYPASEWKRSWEPMGKVYQSAMEAKLMSRFWIGCQFTKNTPAPPEITAAYSLVGSDRQATETFLGMYNYVKEPEDLQKEIGRLLSGVNPQIPQK